MRRDFCNWLRTFPATLRVTGLSSGTDHWSMKPWSVVCAALAVVLSGGCAAGTALQMALHPSDSSESPRPSAAHAETAAAAQYAVDDDQQYAADDDHEIPNEAEIAPVSSTGERSGVVGRWKGKLEAPKDGAEGPMAQMAVGMAKMFLGSLSLELRPDHTFSLNVFVPIEGTYRLEGRSITLTPKTVAGLTEAEAKEMGKAEGKPAKPLKPLKGTIAANGASISLEADDEQGGNLLFERAKPEPPVVSKVSADEKPLVGRWRGSVDVQIPASATDEERKKAAVAARMLHESLELTLRADRRFTLRMMMELEGHWRVSKGQVVLNVDGLAGMGKADSSSSEPVELTIGEGGALLSATKKRPTGTETLSFRRE